MELKLKYGHDLLMRVSDNGIGIEQTIVEQGKSGHFGLQGMRERAARIRGNLTAVSSPGSGTKITLVVPGRIVFRKTSPSLLNKFRKLHRRKRHNSESR